MDISHERASTDRVHCRTMENEEEEDVLQLFLDLSKKLPTEALPSSVENEDTFSHEALDSLPSFLFPVSNWEYQLSWANRPSQGSSERRGTREANKPDGTILKEQFELGFVEIKAPKDAHVTRYYIQDKWALASWAKDAIELHLREQRAITSVICL
ncbi:hypothetical protein BGW42_000423 [Actinomortierella wolfii]|nr:hypothetical protein BGW42_000423 [Actinomortierella wolfii]